MKTKVEITPEFIKEYLEKDIKIDVSKKSRKKEHKFYRTVFYTLCKTLTSYSLSSIGRTYNRRHGTVLNGLRVFQKNYNKRNFRSFRNLYHRLLNELISLSDKSELMNIKELVAVNELKNKFEDDILNLKAAHQIEINQYKRMIDSVCKDPVVEELLRLDKDHLELLKPRLTSFFIMNTRKQINYFTLFCIFIWLVLHFIVYL